MASEGVFPKSDGDIGFASDFNRIDLKFATQSISAQEVTTSITYSDTSSTVTVSGLDVNKTYTLYAIASSEVDGAANVIFCKLVIGSTDVNEIGSSGDGGLQAMVLQGILTGQTGASFTAKVQFRNNNDSTSVRWSNGSREARISIMAFPE